MLKLNVKRKVNDGGRDGKKVKGLTWFKKSKTRECGQEVGRESSRES